MTGQKELGDMEERLGVEAMGEGGAFGGGLAKAARCGDAALVEELLARGADPLEKGADGRLPIARAAWGGHAECVRLLAPLSRLGERPGERLSLLHLAILADSMECVRALATPEEVGAPNRHGWTLLMSAAWHGSARALRELLPWSDPRAADRHGNTALIYAAMKGNAECAEALLPHSDMEAKGRDSKTAADFAREGGHGHLLGLMAHAAAREEAKELAEGCAKGARGSRRAAI